MLLLGETLADVDIVTTEYSMLWLSEYYLMHIHPVRMLTLTILVDLSEINKWYNETWNYSIIQVHENLTFKTLATFLLLLNDLFNEIGSHD